MGAKLDRQHVFLDFLSEKSSSLTTDYSPGFWMDWAFIDIHRPLKEIAALERRKLPRTLELVFLFSAGPQMHLSFWVTETNSSSKRFSVHHGECILPFWHTLSWMWVEGRKKLKSPLTWSHHSSTAI